MLNMFIIRYLNFGKLTRKNLELMRLALRIFL